MNPGAVVECRGGPCDGEKVSLRPDQVERRVLTESGKTVAVYSLKAVPDRSFGGNIVAMVFVRYEAFEGV